MNATDAPRRRRRSKANEMVTIYWRDIPAQVTATTDGEKGSWLLEERFQVAIDRAAGVAGLTDADDYVLQWRRVSAPCAGDPETIARTEAERLQELYDRDRVRSLVDNGGLEPEQSGPSAAKPRPQESPTTPETTNPQSGPSAAKPRPQEPPAIPETTNPQSGPSAAKPRPQEPPATPETTNPQSGPSAAKPRLRGKND